MGPFYRSLLKSSETNRFYNHFFRAGRNMMAFWRQRRNRILKHVGLGGKTHVFERGHVQWNRKGRW